MAGVLGVLVGRDREPLGQLVWSGVLSFGSTVILLVVARVVGEAVAAIGGFLLLGVMTMALIVGAYHAYRNGGVFTSQIPLAGVVAGVGVARGLSTWLGWEIQQGLQTGDLAIVLFGIGLVTAVGSYIVGIVW